MKRNSTAQSILFAFFLSSTPLAVIAADEPVTPTPESHPVRNSSIGCATGATLGFVLPGLGNAVGCVVGGLVGWLWP